MKYILIQRNGVSFVRDENILTLDLVLFLFLCFHKRKKKSKAEQYVVINIHEFEWITFSSVIHMEDKKTQRLLLIVWVLVLTQLEHLHKTSWTTQ